MKMKMKKTTQRKVRRVGLVLVTPVGRAVHFASSRTYLLGQFASITKCGIILNQESLQQIEGYLVTKKWKIKPATLIVEWREP